MICSFPKCSAERHLNRPYCKEHVNEMQRLRLRKNAKKDMGIKKNKYSRPKNYTLAETRHELEAKAKEYAESCDKIMLELKKGYNSELRKQWQDLNNKRITAKEQLRVMHETGRLLGYQETQYKQL